MAVTRVFRVRVARSLRRVRKLWTGRPSSVRPVVCLVTAAGERSALATMLEFAVPPGYRRSRPPARPKLDPYTGIIDGILAADEGRPRKQRHTSKRIFERLPA